jgi:excisionase family DNA binding protein
MVAEQAELERRLNAGKELSPGEVAVLLGVGRTTVHDMLNAGKIRYTKTPGGHRRCDPVDVRRALDERRRKYSGPDEAVHLMPPGPEKAAALEATRRDNHEQTFD